MKYNQFREQVGDGNTAINAQSPNLKFYLTEG